MIEIDIRWEDNGDEVHNLLVSQYDGVDEDNDEAIFYNGLSWQEVQECIKNKTGPAGSEFTILDARLVETPAESCMDCDSSVESDLDAAARAFDDAARAYLAASIDAEADYDDGTTLGDAYVTLIRAIRAVRDALIRATRASRDARADV